MRKIFVFAAGVVMVAMLNSMVLAEQNNNAPAVRQQAAPPNSLVNQATTSRQPAPDKTGLSKRNKVKIEQAEQRKLRQIEINKARAADPQPR
jgi:hypothetical protein